MNKVCHVTSVHKYTDVRIFHKQCISLSKKYDVYLVAPNVKDQTISNVKICGVTLPLGRVRRVMNLNRIYKRALEIDADIYHFHDPELMKMGLKFKQRGKKVVFDSHEDIPLDIAEKKWIPSLFRPLLSRYYENLQKRILPQYDALVSVTPSIIDKLKQLNINTYQITNYPIYKDFEDNRKWNNSICFAGLISPSWLHHNVIDALSACNITYEIVGPSDPDYISKLSKLASWNKVSYGGTIKHGEVYSYIQRSMAGIALYDYLPSFGYKLGSLGNNKIFEYMAAGVPVIATDFVLWRDLIEKNNCGICVNPHDIDAIKNAIIYLLNNPQKARIMGDNGARVSRELFNWESQENILFTLYEKLV